MAVRLQLFVLFVVIIAVMNFGCGDSSQSTPPTTVMVSSPSHVPTDEVSTQSTTRAPVPYACPQHTCMAKCQGYVWDRLHYCHCDPLCVSYGDCCPDYADVCGPGKGEDIIEADQSTEIYGNNTFLNLTSVGSVVTMTRAVEGKYSLQDEFTKCVQTIDFDPKGHHPRSGHRLVALCLQDWSGDPGIRTLCQITAGTDGIAAIPVEGTNGRHYKNVYCALCHGLPTDNVTFWSVSYEEKKSGNLVYLNASQMLEIAKETQPNQAFTISFNPPGYTDRETFSPHLEESSLRSCIILDPLPCPINDPNTQDLCDQYTAPIAMNGTTYRNLACMWCNNSQAHTTRVHEWCESLAGATLKTPLSMATLLVFSDHAVIDGLKEDYTESSSCEANQLYDPFLDFCRDLACPDGFVLEDGVRCARIHENLVTLLSNVKITLSVTGSFHIGSDDQSTENSFSAGIWEEVAYKAADDYLSYVSVCKDREKSVGNMGQTDQGSLSCDKVNFTWTCSMDVVILNSAEGCATGSVFSCNVNMSFNSEAPSTDRMIDMNKMLLIKCFQGNLWNHTIRLDYFTVSAPCITKSNETKAAKNGSSDGLVPISNIAYVWDDFSGHFIVSQNDSCKKVDCPLLTFSKDDYVMTGALNDSIWLTLYDRVLKRGEFKLKDNGDVEVCNFLQNATPVVSGPGTTDGMWDYAHFILTVTGSSLSLIGVIVTIATYASFPVLRRNAAGKSLMCLVASLFLAQLTMLIGLDRTDVIALCVTFAISSHFFWLAAFFWMNILAIDIYRTFGIGTKMNDPNTRSFRYYALYGLGAPALIVCTCAALSFCDCVEVDVHYGSERACWIGNGMANLVSFGIPIVGILCSNAVLFSLTVAGVMKTRRESERMNIKQGQSDASAKKPNTDLILYLKLTAIMGFTWLFGFVASFSGVQFFWYLFIIFNSLQGALVCLAFVCNQRVFRMWKARVKGSHGRYSTDSISSRTRRVQMSGQTSAVEISATEISTNLRKA